jgi:hemoglobin-like flavoprotein
MAHTLECCLSGGLRSNNGADQPPGHSSQHDRRQEVAFVLGLSIFPTSRSSSTQQPFHRFRLAFYSFYRFFELEPSAKDIFGWGKDSGTKLIENTKRFQKHSIFFIQMLHMALGFLGPDIEFLTEVLLELGAKHAQYGVKPEYFPSMGRALLHSLQETLGDEFTQQTRDAWVEVYGAMSYDMIRAQNRSWLDV